MDKTRLIVSETFRSATEKERRENIQHAVDRYLQLLLKSGGLPFGDEPDGPEE